RYKALLKTAKYASRGEFNKRVLDLLVNFLGDKDNNARSISAWTIAKYGQNKLFTEKAINPLLKMLRKEEDKDTFTNVTMALAVYTEGNHVSDKDIDKSRLLKLLDSENEKVRANAALLFGHLANRNFVAKEVFEKIVSLLDDNDLSVRRNASYAVLSYAEKDMLDANIMEKLIEGLQDWEGVKINNILTLGIYAEKGFTDERALEKLVKLLKDRNKDVKENAAETLIKYANKNLTDERVLETCVKLLKDKNVEIRKAAARLLALYAKKNIVNLNAVKPLRKAVEDETIAQDAKLTLKRYKEAGIIDKE
ncbi:MAG: HEAT repeat domain-containing protein, partial [Candidatus Jordarchaeaceae archaeon]